MKGDRFDYHCSIPLDPGPSFTEGHDPGKKGLDLVTKRVTVLRRITHPTPGWVIGDTI